MATTRPTASSRKDRPTAYARDVVAGRILAGPHVRNACRRHLDDLKHGGARGLRWNAKLAAEKIALFEEVYKLSEGQFEGQAFILDPSQAFIIGSIYGWQSSRWAKGEWRRRFRRAFVEMGKGNGKSPMAAGIGIEGLVAAGEAGAQIYSAAAKRDQAAILFQDAVKMVRGSPALRRRLAVQGSQGHEHNIAHHLSASYFRPASRETGKTGAGLRPFYVLADEIHEMADRRILETLERGFKFRREPLLFMITNSGSDPNSVAGQEHDHAVRVAAGSPDPVGLDATYVGDPIDDSTFSYVCALDEGDDPLTDPSCWGKANPLLGITLTEEYLASVVAQAKNIPSTRNEILRLHFCIWTEADVAWISRELLDPALSDFDPGIHAGEGCAVGLDLSERRDLTVKANVVRTGMVKIEAMRDGEMVTVEKPTFDAWIEAWTPGDTMKVRAVRDKLPYEVWEQQGWLYAPPGKMVSFLQVAQALAEDMSEFDVRLVAYDRYAFQRFEEDVALVGIVPEFVEHPQGGVKKGKPTEAMKRMAKEAEPPREPEGLWMPGSLAVVEEALLEGRLRLRRNPVLVSAMLSAVVETDKWGNKWLAKARSVNKIDAAVALCMAMGAAMACLVDDEVSGMAGWLAQS